MILQFLDKTFPALGIGVAPVHKTMNESLLHPKLFCQITKGKKVIQGTVHAPIGYQTHEMHLLPVLASVSERFHDLRILSYRMVTASPVDFHQVLIDNPSRTDIQMPHLGISHLPVRQTYIFSARVK